MPSRAVPVRLPRPPYTREEFAKVLTLLRKVTTEVNTETDSIRTWLNGDGETHTPGKYILLV